MPSIKIVAKEGHEVLSQTTDKNSVALTEASVVTLGVAKADISEQRQQQWLRQNKRIKMQKMP
jgi:hypothetical protein